MASASRRSPSCILLCDFMIAVSHVSYRVLLILDRRLADSRYVSMVWEGLFREECPSASTLIMRSLKRSWTGRSLSDSLTMTDPP